MEFCVKKLQVCPFIVNEGVVLFKFWVRRYKRAHFGLYFNVLNIFLVFFAKLHFSLSIYL